VVGLDVLVKVLERHEALDDLEIVHHASAVFG
jgi:hypothetical protein